MEYFYWAVGLFLVFMLTFSGIMTWQMWDDVAAGPVEPAANVTDNDSMLDAVGAGVGWTFDLFFDIFRPQSVADEAEPESDLVRILIND